MKFIALCTLILLAACADPRLSAGISVGAGGASITPSISGGLGKGRISYTP